MPTRPNDNDKSALPFLAPKLPFCLALDPPGVLASLICHLPEHPTATTLAGLGTDEMIDERPPGGKGIGGVESWLSFSRKNVDTERHAWARRKKGGSSNGANQIEKGHRMPLR